MGPRGRTRGRGRGQFRRGGGSRRGGKRQRIDSERDAEKTELRVDELDHPSSEDDGNISADDYESEDDEEPSSTRPYMTLLQSFTGNVVPEKKKRKLDHNPSTTSMPEPQIPSEDDSDDEKDIDEVEEPENDPEDGMIEEQEENDDGDDDEEDSSDPFDRHFANPEENSTSRRVKALQQGQRQTNRRIVQNLRAITTSPKLDDDASDFPPPPIAVLDELKLKQRLKASASRSISSLTDIQQFLAPLIFNYHDISFNARTLKNASDIRQLLCLHALNHVFKTRDRVIKNNHKLAKEEPNPNIEFRDQGFTRPKVLFLLPTRNSCLKMVNTIRDLCEPDQQENRKRFDEAYNEEDLEFGPNKPADFKDLFGGNDDDMFRIGVKLTRKTIKYFAQFYTSDMLFASPLGLRTAIGSDSEGEKKAKLDYDFLSSVEIVIVDQADALLMQNWEHVEFIFEHLNLQPKDAHGCDFARVRSWCLEDQSKYFRQTVVLSSFNTPELSELMRAYCHNWAGQVRLQPEYPGLLQNLGVRARQTFSRFEPGSIDVDPDTRFHYFVSAVVPSLTKTRDKDIGGTLVFIPSYLDFVRVRNYFNASTVVPASIGYISEYSAVPDASRARSYFMNQKHQILLYTERAHHFRRYVIKGVRRVIFYGLPDNPLFYREIAGDFLGDSERSARIDPGKASIRVIFSKYDVFKLERVVGTQRAGKMVSERGDTFEFI